MNITPVRIAIILGGVALCILCLEGCATRGYVDRKCYETNRKAREYSREQAWDCLEYISDVEDKVDLIAKKSEVALSASAKTRASLSLTDVLERQKSEAIDRATEDYRQVLRDFHRASIQIVEELSK